jgi:hypothetical protein
MKNPLVVHQKQYPLHYPSRPNIPGNMQQQINAGAAPQLALHASIDHDRVPATANLKIIKRLDELTLNTSQRRLSLRVPLVE